MDKDILNQQKIKKLYSFKKEKYNRIEPIKHNNNTILFFVLDNPKIQNLCGVMIESDRLILECGGDSDLIASLHEYGEETARFCYDLGNKVNKIFKKPKINDGFSPPKGIF